MKKNHIRSFADLDKIFPSQNASEKKEELESKKNFQSSDSSLRLNEVSILKEKNSGNIKNTLLEKEKELEIIEARNREFAKKLKTIATEVIKKEKENSVFASHLAEFEKLLEENEIKNQLKRRELDRFEIILSEREKDLKKLEQNLNSRIAKIKKREAANVDEELKAIQKDNFILHETINDQDLKIQKLSENETSQNQVIKVAYSIIDDLNKKIDALSKQYEEEIKNLVSNKEQFEIELNKLRPIQRKYMALSAEHKEAKDAILKLESATETPDTFCPIGQFYLSNSTIIDWLTSYENIATFHMPRHVTILGEGPIDSKQWISHLENFNCKSWLNGNEWIIVEREGWSEERIDALIAERCEEPIFIVSQEIFLAAMISGKNPFDAGEDLLFAFAEDHPALQYIINSYFDWPFYDEVLSDEGPNIEITSVEKSPLKLMGYTVGKNGEEKNYRRQILKEAYLGKIPWTESDEYMKAWGRAQTRRRLWRISHHLAMLIKKARRKDNMNEAINHWEQDLNWLYRKFYLANGMDFKWPF
jgi:hypothetical protein